MFFFTTFSLFLCDQKFGTKHIDGSQEHACKFGCLQDVRRLFKLTINLRDTHDGNPKLRQIARK